MRAVLDKLLFALPPLPSRASLVRGGLYLLFGLTLYALFLGLFSVRERGAEAVARLCQSLPNVRVDMSRPELSFFPPALDIASLSVQTPHAAEGLTLRNIRTRLTVFPSGVALSAEVAGGELAATVIPATLWKPERFDVQATLSGALVVPMLRPFTGNNALVRLEGGKLDAEAALALPLVNGLPAPFAGGGNLTLHLRGGRADLGLPMLKQPRLDKLEATLEAVWNKEKLDLRRVDLRSPILACTVQGGVTLAPKDWPASRMDLQSSLRVAPEHLRQEFMPERTLQSLKDTGEVKVRLRDTFRRPSFDVQP